MSNWGEKIFVGFLTLIFLVIFMPYTLKTNVSSRSIYSDKIDSCYELLEDRVLYKNFQRLLRLRSLEDPQKSSNSNYLGRLSYTNVPDELKNNPYLIRGAPFEKAIAVIPAGSKIRVRQIFIFDSSASRNRTQLVGHIELPQFRGIDIQLNDLFEVYTPECKPKLDVIKSIACPEKLEKR